MGFLSTSLKNYLNKINKKIKLFILNNLSGFNLVEMMITTSITSILSLAVARTIYNSNIQTNTSTQPTSVVGLINSLRQAALNPDALIVSSWHNTSLNPAINSYSSLSTNNYPVFLATQAGGCPLKYQPTYITINQKQEVPTLICTSSASSTPSNCLASCSCPLNYNGLTVASWSKTLVTPVDLQTTAAICVAQISNPGAATNQSPSAQPSPFDLYGAANQVLAGTNVYYNADGTHCSGSSCLIGATSTISYTNPGTKGTYNAMITVTLMPGPGLTCTPTPTNRSFQTLCNQLNPPLSFTVTSPTTSMAVASHQDLSVSLGGPSHGFNFTPNGHFNPPINAGNACSSPNQVVINTTTLWICVNGVWKTIAGTTNCPGTWVPNPVPNSQGGLTVCQVNGSSCPPNMQPVTYNSYQLTTTDPVPTTRGCDVCTLSQFSSGCGVVLDPKAGRNVSCDESYTDQVVDAVPQTVTSRSHPWGVFQDDTIVVNNFAECGCDLDFGPLAGTTTAKSNITQIGCY